MTETPQIDDRTKNTPGQNEPSKISVVVPIYNAEPYLDQALSSIRDQTYKNIEIICINDGSTDTSLETIKRHAAEDDRIIVVDKENQGYGATCNRGLDMATGQWVTVMEPDDYLELTMFEDMITFGESFGEHVDIVKTPWYVVMGWDLDQIAPQDREYYEPAVNPSGLYRRYKTSSRPQTIKELTYFLEDHPAVWSAIYRTDFLRENNIRFIEYPGAGWADNPFLIDTMLRAKNMVYLDHPYYYYRADLAGATLGHIKEDLVARPFDRWLTMMDIIEDMGIDDEEILASHYFRGFSYVAGAIFDDGWDNPVVQEKTAEVFSRMNKDIVINHPKLHNERKKFYLEVTGQEAELGSGKEYRRYLIDETKRNVRAMGIMNTLKRIMEHNPTKKEPIAARDSEFEYLYDERDETKVIGKVYKRKKRGGSTDN